MQFHPVSSLHLPVGLENQTSFTEMWSFSFSFVSFACAEVSRALKTQEVQDFKRSKAEVSKANTLYLKPRKLGPKFSSIHTFISHNSKKSDR